MSEPDPYRGPSPEEEQLSRARVLFEVGDYLLLREVAEPLTKSPDPAIQAAAQELLRKIEVDPVAKWVGLGTLLVLCAITYWYVVR